jgi:hypothetical protein
LVGTKTEVSFDGLNDEVADHFGLFFVGTADKELIEEGLLRDFLEEGLDKMESSFGIRMLEEDLIDGVKELKNGSKMFEPEIDEKSVGD